MPTMPEVNGTVRSSPGSNSERPVKVSGSGSLPDVSAGRLPFFTLSFVMMACEDSDKWHVDSWA
jgi:hypothetical protein